MINKIELLVLKSQLESLGNARSRSPGSTKRMANPKDSGLTFKVALVGPRQGGKTRIAAQLSGSAIPPESHYEPTQGVRILNFSETIQKSKNESVNAKIELWDLSGETSENLWPAAVKDLVGVMVVFDPTSKQQANDVRIWCEWFCKAAKLKTGQCIIFAHGALTSRHKPLSVRAGLGNEDRTISVPIVNVNYQLQHEQDGKMVGVPSAAKSEFSQFLGKLYKHHPDNLTN